MNDAIAFQRMPEMQAVWRNEIDIYADFRIVNLYARYRSHLDSRFRENDTSVRANRLDKALVGDFGWRIYWY